MSIFRKYQYWVSSGKYSTIQKFVMLFVGLLSFKLLTRVMSPSDFGVWGLFLVITSIVETARSALIRNAFIRHTHQADSEAEQDQLQSSAFLLNLTVSLVIGGLIALSLYPVTHFLHAPELSQMLRWYIVTIVISCLFSHFEMLLNTRLDFKGICFMYCNRQAILLIFFIICAVFTIQLQAWMLSVFYLVSMLGGIVTGYFFCRGHLVFRFRDTRVDMIRLWQYGKFVFGTNVSAMLFRSTDNFMAFKFFGSATSAFYNASYRISNLVDLPSQVFSDLLFPKAAMISSDNPASVRHMYERTVGAILVFSVPALLVVIAVPELLLHIFADEKYLAAAGILRITAFFGFTLPFIKQFGTIMDATGHPHVNFRVMLLSVFLNIVNNLVGIKLLGSFGPAAGTALTYFIIFILTQYILYRKFGIRLLNTFRNMFKLYGELLETARSVVRKNKVKQA